MNTKFAVVMLAAVAGLITIPNAEAKPKFYGNAQNNSFAAGGCYGPGAYTGSQPYGWNQGNAYWKNNNSGVINAGWQNRWNGVGNNANNGWFNNRFNGRLSDIDTIQSRLSDRIQRGITSGRLTQSEANRLRQMETRINGLETRYRADNRLSYQERSRLNSELGKLSDRLRRELTDRQIF